MNRIVRRLRCCGIVTVVVSTVVVLALGGIAIADVVTASLAITPTPCKRGDVLHFTVTVFNNPNVAAAPGTAYYCAVVLDNTNHPELDPWHSELQVFKYPYQGKTAIVNFSSTYTVPAHLKGTTICFYVTEGQAMTNKISYKHCIQVKALIKQKPIIKEIKTIERQTTK